MVHLDTEQLLELLHGDADAERLDACLEHLDNCSECAGSFAVMTTLRAHRDEALAALAAGTRRPEPSHTDAEVIRPMIPAWSRVALRAAAAVAVVALGVSLFRSAPIAPVGPTSGVDQRLAALATDDIRPVVRDTRADRGIRLSSETPGRVNDVLEELRAGRYQTALESLEELVSILPENLDLQLLLGIAQYATGDDEAAVATLRRLEDVSDSYRARTALWYEANALVRQGRAREALVLLDRLLVEDAGSDLPERVTRAHLFQGVASQLRADIREILETRSR